MIRIASGDTVADIAWRGAELTRWRVGERDLLWTGDAAWWDEQSPLLFPVVGWTRDGASRVGGQTYPLGLHGFARREDFTLEETAPDMARLSLRDNPATRALYPFAFELTVTYRVVAAGVSARARILNRGDRPMPYAFGFHPGFRWPFAAQSPDGHMILFDRAERPLVPVIAPGGLIGAQMRKVPLEGRQLALSPELFAGDALCFLNARSQGLRFVDPEGRAIVMETENLPHLALWTRPGAPFLCLEPWTGHSDPEGFTGDLFDKPSMIVLAPGQAQSHAARWRFEQKS